MAIIQNPQPRSIKLPLSHDAATGHLPTHIELSPIVMFAMSSLSSISCVCSWICLQISSLRPRQSERAPCM
eukprot:19567-Eustigmatos_ZCMA.PRE.1